MYRLFFNPGSERAVLVANNCAEKGVECVEVSRPGLDRLCTKEDKYKSHFVHQGLVADVSKMQYIPLDYNNPNVSLPPVPDQWSVSPDPGQCPAPVCVMVCSVRDPGNLGSIIRTSYYLGVSQLIVTGAKCQLSSVVSKASSGTLEISPVFAVKNAKKFIQEKQIEGWRVLAADIPDYFTDVDYDEGDDLNFTPDSPKQVSSVSVDNFTNNHQPILLVLGSEGSGVPEELLEIIKEKIFVSPSRIVDLSVDSLNVSVAAGIIIHKLCQHLRNTS